ncbi:MAG: hypothetical protein QGG90_12590, partial [Nitrospinota bacterium]|nr:hypothetical protein [Nitrospinota bacterium]
LGYKDRFERLFCELEGFPGELPLPCHFSRAFRVEEEGARLNAEKTCLSFRIHPLSLLDEGRLAYLIRHERIHVQDLLDPAFGHDETRPLSDGSPVSEDLLRDRYRTLWDLSVDGRLERIDRLPEGVRDQRAAEFGALFRTLGQERTRRIFETLWSGPRREDADLRQMVLSTEHLCEVLAVSVSGGGEGADVDLRAGGPCPLCRFPTFDWADPSEDLTRRVKAEFPDWRPSEGLCSQCANRYLLGMTPAPAGECCGQDGGSLKAAIPV